MEKQKIVLIDVDGTISKIDHRLYLIKKTPKDWVGFYDAAKEDEPLLDNIKMIKEALAELGAEPVFVTGRSDVIRGPTAAWIYKHFFETPSAEFVHQLYMRKEGDHREDLIIKREIYDTHLLPHDILRVYEDRPSVIRMYKDLGLDVVDLGPGIDF
jgi:hypothetical protein